MINRTVDNLIIGATFYGVGLAMTLPNSLIIERRDYVGYDFSGSMNGNIGYDGVSIHESAGALARTVLEKGINILLDTEIISACDGVATLFCDEGIMRVRYGRIINATPRGKRYYCCSATNGDILRVAAQEGDFAIARERLRETALIRKAKIAFFASDFAFDGWYKTPNEALCAGQQQKDISDYRVPEVAVCSDISANTCADICADICVVGLGTAGSMAAIAAAKQGASVIGVELRNMMGGTAVCGCVYDYYFGMSGGEYEKINEKCINDIAFAKSNKRHIVGAAKAYYLERETAINCLYGGRAVAAEVENGVVRQLSVMCEDKSYIIRAKQFVDGSGGMLARLCGAKTECGRRSDGKTMPFSKAAAVIRNGSVYGEWSNGGYLGNDIFKRTQLLLAAASESPCLESDIPPVGIASMAGVRERYRVECDGRLELFGDSGERPLFYAFAPVDNTNKDFENEDNELVDWHCIIGLNAYAESVAVPKSVLTAKGFDNLIITGKSIGQSHAMAGCVRMKSDMERCGECAGVLAALRVQGLPDSEVYGRIDCVGAPVELTDIGGNNATVILPQTEQEIITALGSDTPQTALYQLRRGAVLMNDTLYERMQQHDRTGEVCAVALGMLGDKRCTERLCELARSKPEYYGITRAQYSYSWYKDTIHCNRDKARLLLERMGE